MKLCKDCKNYISTGYLSGRCRTENINIVTGEKALQWAAVERKYNCGVNEPKRFEPILKPKNIWECLKFWFNGKTESKGPG